MRAIARLRFKQSNLRLAARMGDAVCVSLLAQDT
jgi:hypothetical protein